MVYARTAVSQKDWDGMTLRDLGVDGKDGGAGVLLTLNLPSGSTSTSTSSGGGVGAAAAGSAGAGASSTSATAAASASTSASSATAATAAADDQPQPMDIDPASATPTPLATPSSALTQILSQNFDADIVPCVLTLIKLLDNIISTYPYDDVRGRKVRCINLENSAFEAKVGRVTGGIDFLLSCGFERQQQQGL